MALGLDEHKLAEMEPESDLFFKNVWLKTAADNSAIYWDVFRNLPNNCVASYLDTNDDTYKRWKTGMSNQ